MAETAALLVEHRLPDAPWRQWVLSFEGPMAVRLGYNRQLLGRVCLRFALAEHLEHASEGEPVDETLVACVQLGLPLRAVGPPPCEPPATFAQMTPDTFLARLCAFVPPPRAHTVLYYGVLSAHHARRSAVVPRDDEPEPEPEQLSLFIPRGQLELPAITTLLHAQLRDSARSRLPWMKLVARVFRIDISVCSRCSGPMRVSRPVTTPEHIAAEFRGARPPPRTAPVGQLLLFSALPPAP